MPSTQWTHEEEEDSRPKWRELACISPRDCGMYLKLQSVMWGTINSRTTSSKRLNNEWWRCITKSQQKLGWEMLHHHNWIEIGAQYLQATGTRVLHCSSCKQCKRKRWTRSDNIVLMMSLLAICRNASSVWLLCRKSYWCYFQSLCAMPENLFLRFDSRFTLLLRFALQWCIAALVVGHTRRHLHNIKL